MGRITNENQTKVKILSIMMVIIILMTTVINMYPTISNAAEEETTGVEDETQIETETEKEDDETSEDLVEITFKDEILYKKMVADLKFKIESKTDATKTIKMTKENLESVTTILISTADETNAISDISGIEKFTNLTKLNASNNKISDISALKGLTNLTELYLNYNNISDISSLKELTNLTRLALGNNKISDISTLKGLTNLSELNLMRNQISDISPIIPAIETAKIIRINGQEIKAEINDNSHIVQLPKIFAQAKELMNREGYNGKWEFIYIGCTLNADGKSVTVNEGTNIATAWIQAPDSISEIHDDRIDISVRFEIVDNYKTTPSNGNENGNGNTQNGEEKKDGTQATGKLPNTGESAIILLAILLIAGIAVILKTKVNKYKGIK